MNHKGLLVDATTLWAGEAPNQGPMLLVDLNRGSQIAGKVMLPPIPVLGVGDGSNPVAEHLDAIVESPIALERVVQQVEASPKAAATVVQLLRMLPGLSIQNGLTAESMAYAMLQGSAEHRDWLIARTTDNIPQPEGRVAVLREGDCISITLDRPEAGNAIDRAMRDALYEAFSLATLDNSVERVLLQGNGKTFSLGAELSEFGTTTDPATAHAIRCRTLPVRMAALCTDRFEVHVQGGCVGAGLEIAAYANRFTATSNAWFQLPELSMGILPGAGGCVSLTRRIGRQRTALMILSGKRLNARTALEWGLIDAIVDDPA